MDGLFRWRFLTAFLSTLVLIASPAARAQNTVAEAGEGATLYRAIKSFALGGGSVTADGLSLKRDRAEMTFHGTFYFARPISGHTYGAVFIGDGTFHADVPPSEFERENVQRLLKADVVESNFKTAVLRFSDDTFEVIGKGLSPGEPPQEALKLAEECEPRLLRETGTNISARLVASVLNQEKPGFFLAQFDKGKRGRFTFVMDYQMRIPVAAFEINAGEKGLIFAHRSELYDNDVWMAFYSLDDYTRRNVEYSDTQDRVNVLSYQVQVDAREPDKWLRYDVTLNLEALRDGLRAISLVLGEDLGEYDNLRMKKGLRIRELQWNGAGRAEAVQEDWEGGFTILLPSAKSAGDKFSVTAHIEGEFMWTPDWNHDVHYPISNDSWLPRHGYLQRSAYDLTFRVRKNQHVVSLGQQVREEAAPNNPSETVSEWRMDKPVPLATFGVGRWEIHRETAKGPTGEVPVDFYSLSGSVLVLKEDFVLAEMMNALNYFGAVFGAYPYGVFHGMYHPRGYGQGFPSMLCLPRADRSSKYVYRFIAHETAHQWWGGVVTWRSYRDQWLSEGFADYSGLLYTQLRDKGNGWKELLDEDRDILRYPPRTEVGVGKGKLAEVGPLILGHRVSTRQTFGAYTALTYSKGCLVLRMLHFLFTDPATGDGKAFFEMMADFVRRYQGGWASTDDFRQVANEHFAQTPIAQRAGLKDLNWFFREWVFQAHLPSYRMTYSLEEQTDHTVLLKGVVYQENLPETEKWLMPLPVLVHSGKDRVAHVIVYSYGPQTPFTFRFGERPTKVELDPDHWVLSEKTSTSGP